MPKNLAADKPMYVATARKWDDDFKRIDHQNDRGRGILKRKHFERIDFQGK
jgi:adenosylcobinamide kinase/adenosylcobinamide-phosphate guanylyltransferase